MISTFTSQKSNDQVTVCICTYKRPNLLSKLLEKISKQKTDNKFKFHIIVVDNDFHESAKVVVDRFKTTSQINIQYFTEKIQNISKARNKAVCNAKGDFIALIDDDEFPENEWLLNLYNTFMAYEADCVLGPVIPHFQELPPNWIIKSKLFHRNTLSTGCIAKLINCRTGNVLLKQNIFDDSQNFFKEEFGRTGGEDIEFFRSLISQGRKIIWCNEAKAYETIPPERWRKSFILNKYLRIGGLTGEKVRKGYRNRFLFLLHSFAGLFVYSLFLPVSIPFGFHLLFKSFVKIVYYTGCVLGFVGIVISRFRP